MATSRAATTVGSALQLFRTRVAAQQGAAWPSTKYQADPIGFAFDVLGVEPWGKQQAILESVRDNRHTAVSGGRKVGKDAVGGMAVWWWYCSFPRARAMCFGPTMKQVDEIIYLEIRGLWLGHGRCVKCKRDNPTGPRPCPHSMLIPEKPGLSAKTGVESPDLRQIVGVTAAGEGGARGFSGRMLVVEDEAADMKDEVDTAIVGNLAGEDTRRLMISNPVRTRGFFFRAFHTERDIFGAGLFQISSEESPNVVEGRTVHPGLASREWLAERERAWGKGSPMWLWHVEGKFLKAEAGQLFSIDAVTDAERRHGVAEAVGRLQVGIDVAGEGQDGDETAMAARRGDKCLELDAKRGQTPEAILVNALGMLRKHRVPRDQGDNRPIVVVDRDGAEGAKVYGVFASHAYQHPDDFELIGFRGGERPKGILGQTYRLNRDLLFGGLLAWFRAAGGIPVDLMLEAELLELRWVDAEGGKQILIPKSELRDILGRSPDRCDSLALSTWREVRPFKTATDEEDAAAAQLRRPSTEEVFDAYEAAGDIGADSVFDPYK